MASKVGRKPLASIPYFPFQCDLLRDKKFRRVKQKHGYLGMIVYISILTHIFDDKGYYVKYDDDLLWEIQQDLAGKYQPDIDTIAEVVELLVGGELFSADHFEQKYLTSKRIQQSYYRATVERIGIDIDFDIWMLSVPEMEEISKNSFILQNCKTRPINSISRPINSINRAENGQMKSKSKSIKNNTSTTSAGEKDAIPIFKMFEQEFARQITPTEFNEVVAWREQHSDEIIAMALKEAVLHSKISFGYIRAILTSWNKLGIKTKAQAEKQIVEFGKQYSPAKKQDDRKIPSWYKEEQMEQEQASANDIDEVNRLLKEMR